MKTIWTLFIILSFALIPFVPFSQDSISNTTLASVEYLNREAPIKKQKVKKKKHPRKPLKKERKKQTDKNPRKGIPVFLMIMAGLLFASLLAWAIYFFPLLASGTLGASWGCFAPVGIFLLGFVGLFLSLILLAGVVLLIIFTIVIINRNKIEKNKASTDSYTSEGLSKEVDYIKIQIRDKASKDFPNLPAETLEKYVAIKNYIVELKYDRSKLEAIKSRDPLNRIQRKIDSLDEKIAAKEALIDIIEKTHVDLEAIPTSKRLAYINIKLRLARLQYEQKKYQQKDDFRSISKLRYLEKAIKEQEEALKLLLDTRND